MLGYWTEFSMAEWITGYRFRLPCCEGRGLDLGKRWMRGFLDWLALGDAFPRSRYCTADEGRRSLLSIMPVL